MFYNAEFFKSVIQKHITEKAKYSADGNVTVELCQGETKYLIAKIVEVADDALVVEVYPEKGALRRYPKEERNLGAPLYDLDRIALPYSAISRVVVTTRKNAKAPLGFQTPA